MTVLHLLTSWDHFIAFGNHSQTWHKKSYSEMVVTGFGGFKIWVFEATLETLIH